MRKVLRNHMEVCHFWANRVQGSGQANNMRFEGDLLYSYSTPIAKHLSPTVTLFDSTSFSNSTSKHQRYARRASHAQTKLYLPCRDKRYRSDLQPYSREGMEREINELLEKAARATKYSNDYLSNARQLARDWNTYVETVYPDESKRPSEYHPLLPVPELDPNLREKIRERQRAQAEAERKREAEQAEKDKELLATITEQLVKWRNDPTITSWNRYAATRLPPALRISADGERVETSWQADVPLSHAQRLWGLLQQRVVRESERVGHYAVKSATDQTLTIGCHKIPMTEVQALATRHPDLFPPLEVNNG